MAGNRSALADERRFWTHELLLWQARRTAADGWASLFNGAVAKPYCEEAGMRYAQAAEKLILAGNANLESSERKRKLADVATTRSTLVAQVSISAGTRSKT